VRVEAAEQIVKSGSPIEADVAVVFGLAEISGQLGHKSLAFFLVHLLASRRHGTVLSFRCREWTRDFGLANELDFVEHMRQDGKSAAVDTGCRSSGRKGNAAR
jgi:hypothetical protein